MHGSTACYSDAKVAIENIQVHVDFKPVRIHVKPRA